MSVQGFINRIRRQAGLPTTPPNLAADELQFDPVAGVFYFSPVGGGAPQIVQPRALSGIIVGGWEEESSLEWNPDPGNTVPGTITVGRVGGGDYYIRTDATPSMSSIIQGFDYQKIKIVGFDGFNNGGHVLELPVTPAGGVPGGSLGIAVRNLVSGAKQEMNGAFQIRLPY